MMNELRVSLISRLEGAQRARGGTRTARSFRRSSDHFSAQVSGDEAIRVTESNRSRALSIPGIITFNHKFHFVVCRKSGSGGGSYVLNMDKLSQLESREVIPASNGSVNSSAVVMGGCCSGRRRKEGGSWLNESTVNALRHNLICHSEPFVM